MSESKPPFLRRVILRNYKSIKECDVSLGPLTLLVGPNGSGKSNFLDALSFVSESLHTPLGEALRERGGVHEVCRRSRDGPGRLSIELHLALPAGETASYRLVVLAKPHDEFEIEEESCRITVVGQSAAEYCVRKEHVEYASFDPAPPASNDQLYLAVAAGFREFRGLHSLLRGMVFYNLSPAKMRKSAFARSYPLRKDGAGFGTVSRRIAKAKPRTKQRIDEYMRTILPAFVEVRAETLEELLAREGAHQAKAYGNSEQLFLWFVLQAERKPILFSPTNMSDGTLAAFGVLLALFQCFDRPANDPIALVGIEEPEATLHPAAAGVLFDALHEASYFTQVLATTHSAELLNVKDLDPASLLVVDAAEGETIIGPADDASVATIRDRLFMAGELLEMNQLRPNPKPPGTSGIDTVDAPPALAPDDQ